MSAPRVITGEVTAWLTSNSYGPEDLLNGAPETVIHKVMLSAHDMTSAGWVKVGTAQYTLTLIDESVMVANKVEAIKAEIKNERAQCENKITHLTQQLQSLLAISNEVQL